MSARSAKNTDRSRASLCAAASPELQYTVSRIYGDGSFDIDQLAQVVGKLLDNEIAGDEAYNRDRVLDKRPRRLAFCPNASEECV